MNPLLYRATLATASAMAVVLAAMPVAAGKPVSVTVQAQVQAPFQILGADAFCSGWTVGTDAATGTSTVTCVPVNSAGAPGGCSATINGTSSVTLPNSGGSVALAANCTTPATGVTYNWSRNGAAASTNATWSETLPANTSTTISSTTSYQVSACVGAACVSVPSMPLTAIVPSAVGVGAPIGCVANINGATSASLPASGGPVNLTVSCPSATVGTTYSWTRNGASAANTANWTDTPPDNTGATNTSTTSYQAQVCNGSACVTVPQTPLTATRAATQVSGAWNGTCPGFDRTVLIQMDWNHPVRMYTSQYGGLTPNGIVVMQFTTGSASSPSNNLPKIGAAEYASTPTARYAVLSTKPCDFSDQPMPGASASGYSVTVPFAVGDGANFGYYPALQNNTTYYFNIKNMAGAACAMNGICDVFVDLLKTPGL